MKKASCRLIRLLSVSAIMASVLAGASCGRLYIEETPLDPAATSSSTGTSASRVTAFSLAVTLPIASRIYYVSDETAVRTVTFNYNDPGDATLECSSDGGGSFSSCTSGTTLVWTTANYNQSHVIRLTSPTIATETYTFTPSTLFPGLTFLTCDVEVAANEDFNTFEATRVNASRTVCLSNGVTISNSGAQDRISFGANNITVIVREGQTGSIQTTRNTGTSTDDTAILLFTRTGIKLIGLTISAAGSGYAITSLSTTAGIYHSTLTASGSGQTIYGDGTYTIVNSTIQQTGTGFESIRGSTGSFTISGSTITSAAGPAFYSWGGTQVFSNSTFQSNTTTRTTVEFLDGTTATLNNNTLVDGGGGGHLYLSNSAAQTTTAEINGNTFKTGAAANPPGGTYSLKGGANGVRTLNSASNGNLFCHVDPARTFDGVKDANFSGGTFVTANQTNAGVIGLCP